MIRHWFFEETLMTSMETLNDVNNYEAQYFKTSMIQLMIDVWLTFSSQI